MTWKEPSTLDNISDTDQEQHHYLHNSRGDFSFLHHLLFQHVIQQKNDGVPIREIENFLRDSNAVKLFLESRGCQFQPRTSPDYEETSDQIGNSQVPQVSILTLSWLRRRAILNLQKLGRILKYILICVVVAVIGHFGMSYVLDINPLAFIPSLMERRCLIPAHPIIMEMARPIADCHFCMGPGAETILEMTEVPNNTAFEQVAYLSKPVIIRGGATKGGMPTHFDFAKLKEIFQSEPGGVDAVSEECQFLPFRSPFQSLKDAFEKIGEGQGWEEPWYIGWSNCHPNVAAKLRKIFPRPKFLPEDSSSSAIDWIFIGSPGMGASMHIDYVKRPSWQAQLAGVKKWLLHPPPECESVCQGSLDFTIYPGDLLFLETNTWYHETHIEGDLFSISIGSEYD